MTIETANVELDEPYATTHLGEEPGLHVVLTVRIAFLHKPFTSDALGRKIRQVLDR